MQYLRIILLVIAQCFPAYCSALLICEPVSDHAPVVCKSPKYTSTDVYVEPKYPKVTDVPLWMILGITSVSASMSGISALFSHMLSMLAFLLPQTESIQPHDHKDNNAELNEVAEWDEHLLAILTGQSNDDLPVRRAGNCVSGTGETYDKASSSKESLPLEGKKRKQTCLSSKRHKKRKDEPPEDNEKVHSYSNSHCAACNADYCSESHKGKALIPKELPVKPDSHPDGCCIPVLADGCLNRIYHQFPEADRASIEADESRYLNCWQEDFKLDGVHPQAMHFVLSLHHFAPIDKSNTDLKENNTRGYETYSDQTLERVFGLTMQETRRIYAMLLNSAFLEDDARNQAKGKIALAYCSHYEQCLMFISSLKKENIPATTSDLSFLKKIPFGIRRHTGLKCGFVSVDMNIQWLSASKRLLWHEDRFRQVEYPMIYTFVAQTVPYTGNGFSSLELGLIEEKYSVYGDGHRYDLPSLHQPAEGWVEVDDAGQIQRLLLKDGTIVFDRNKGFLIRINHPIVYLLVRIPDAFTAGYFVDQRRRYEVSDGKTTLIFKVVHSRSAIGEMKPVERPPKDNYELLEFLSSSSGMGKGADHRRDVMVIRIQTE